MGIFTPCQFCGGEIRANTILGTTEFFCDDCFATIKAARDALKKQRPLGSKGFDAHDSNKWQNQIDQLDALLKKMGENHEKTRRNEQH